MESTHMINTAFFLFLAVVVAMVFKLVNKSKSNLKHQLPPGPWKLPLIGSIHHLLTGSHLPHRRFQQLSAAHGPLIHLKLGEVSMVIASSPDTAREIMKTHDVAFATRPLFPAIDIISYGGSSLTFGPYGERWRQLRRITVVEHLSARRVHSFRSIREEESYHLVSCVTSADGVANLSKLTTEMANSVIVRSTIGCMVDEQKALIEEILNGTSLAAGFDLTDLFPSMGWILRLFSGFQAKVIRCHEKLDAILERIVEQHREKRRRSSPGVEEEEAVVHDLVDVLLRLQEKGELPVELTDKNIKALILDMIGAGSDTSSTTMQWAMSELMRNPKAMKKVQKEIRDALRGKENIKESDITGLNYLKLVIRETLRLHPPIPLVLPRECQNECELLGYRVPAKTRVVVNAWAIGRDPKYWDDADEFRPERFEGKAIDFKGTHYELLPFGSGRRMCPGMLFGLATMELPLALLLYHFDWELPINSKMRSESLDMSESFGITARRKFDLMLRAIPRTSCPSE